MIMKTILVIDDGSASAVTAANFALSIAQRVEANLVLARIYPINQSAPLRAFQLAGSNMACRDVVVTPHGLMAKLQQNAAERGSLIPGIEDIELIVDTEIRLISYIIKNEVWMVIKGVPELVSPGSGGIKVHSILNRIACPLLLVPEGFKKPELKHIVYTADLRYCRKSILKYLAGLAEPFGADLLLAHLSAKGLPHMEQNYALTLFNDEISKQVNYGQLYFNNTRERDVSKAVDVMIHTMHADLLAVVHHRFHCEELIIAGSDTSVPVHLTIPVIVFPY
jgi:hypothetical protein